MKKIQFSIFVVLLLSVLLTGCGGAGNSSIPTASLNVVMTEFSFAPMEMTVFSGQETTLELKNEGGIEHAFTILKKGAAVKIPFDPEKQAGDILVQFKLGAGKSETLTFGLPEPGEYAIICEIPGHMEAGMVGKLTAVQP